MGRQRDPKRDQAFEIWKNSNGEKKLTEIASELDVSPGTVRGWKNKDNWEEKLKGAFQSEKRNAPNKKTERSEKKKRGAPPGNKNALGNKGGVGGPAGNKYGKGHGPPRQNQNALKTGEYKTFWREALDEEELFLLDRHSHIDAIEEMKEEVLQYSLREMFILNRIKALKAGMPPVKTKEVKERTKVKVPVQVEDPLTGEFKTMYRDEYQMITVELQEETADVVAVILSHEEALTRIQDKKVKALDVLFKMTDEFEHKKAMDEIKARIAQEKWDNDKQVAQGDENTSKTHVEAIEEIYARRKARLNKKSRLIEE